MSTLLVATVILHTSMGQVTLELDMDKTPKTAENFLNYVNSGFYDSTIFHRVIDGFMIQGGGLTKEMVQKETNDPIVNEAANAPSNTIGTIAMARTADPHSASSQFFINVADNSFLDFKSETEQGYGYCVFGKVTEGMDIVMDISHVNTVNRDMYQDVPERDVVIESIEVITEKSTPSEQTA